MGGKEMKFSEFVEEFGNPDKVVAVDVKYHYSLIHPDHYDLPVIAGMHVDRLEQNFDTNTCIVFLRCPDELFIREE